MKENILDSSFFTSSTPMNKLENEIMETTTINNVLSEIYKNIMDFDIVIKNNIQNGGMINTETIDIPINYSESSTAITPFDYEEDSSDPSHSSSVTNSSESSSDAYLIKPQKQKIKKASKKKTKPITKRTLKIKTKPKKNSSRKALKNKKKAK